MHVHFCVKKTASDWKIYTRVDAYEAGANYLHFFACASLLRFVRGQIFVHRGESFLS